MSLAVGIGLANARKTDLQSGVLEYSEMGVSVSTFNPLHFFTIVVPIVPFGAEL